MTPPVAWVLAVAALASLADWVAVWLGGSRGRAAERVAKPAVLVLLLVAGALWPAPPGSAGAAARPWLLAGLAGSLAGDVLLLPPGRFVPGLVAFLVAHLAYLGGFLVTGGEAAWLAAGLVAAALMAVTVGRVLLRAARAAGLGGPVALYLAVILGMAVAATRTGEPAAILGAWLFVASDSMLGWGRFHAPAPGMPRGGGRVVGTAVMVTYHAAQALILVALGA